jgi:hypothetical protein
MPKDPKKNVDRYKVAGGHLNEFEFHRNQEQFAEAQASQRENLIPGAPPEAKARRAQGLAKRAQQTAIKKAATTKGSAKKAGTKKAARKQATKTRAKGTANKSTKKAAKK